MSRMTEEERRALGNRVEEARKARGWGKEKASRAAGVSSITWKRVEDGKEVRDTSLAAILRAVGLSESGQGPAADVERLRQDIANARSLSDRDKAILLAQLEAMTTTAPRAGEVGA
jgi:transcriptional regulator with XRE-family HTH domain